MDYFLTNRLCAPISAIEKMMIVRVHLFRHYQRRPVFVTRDYDREVAPLLRQFNLDTNTYLNMFDYFQGFSTMNRNFELIVPNIQHDRVQLSPDGLLRTLYKNDKIIAIFRYRGQTKSLDTISYYDLNGKVTSIELYDSRGWLSMTQLVNYEGRVEVQLFWNRNHELVYSEQYGLSGTGQWVNRSMCLRFDNKTIFFSSMEEMFAYFLDELARHDPQGIFFADRHETAVESLSKMQIATKKYLVMHSSHLVNAKSNPPQLTIWVQKAIKAKFTGFIVSTEKQAIDLRKLVPIPVYNVPVRYLSDKELQRPRMDYASKFNHTILVVARLSAEKRIGDTIEALSLIRKNVRDANLRIFGAPMAGYKEQEKLIQMVKALGLEKCVAFEGYKDNLDEIYPHNSLMVVTSQVEGFNVSILEAMSYGIPVITYDINYGPTTLVINGKNGIVLPSNRPESVARTVEKLWSNVDRLRALSEGAYESCSRYSQRIVWSDWQKLL